ncbi:MAG: 4Fe-4S binding protein [Thermodesulfobacteriota bacterium]|nr:4Fe-4S binding protein [Thermodesulfobacteriota bacterium]
MNLYQWCLMLSYKQRIWLFGTVTIMLVIITAGILATPPAEPVKAVKVNVEMSIRDIAPILNVTGKALARELGLPLDVSKKKSLDTLQVKPETLQHAAHHLLSHHDTTLKYYLYAALVLGGLVFLTRLGRPDLCGIDHRSQWYPRFPYIASLLISVMVAGFLLGKSPNPMEGAVKVFKSMAGLYADPAAKVTAFIFFITLAVIGNKLICGWACPFGALQELIYSIPVLKKIKKHKLSFAFTNTIRGSLFVVMLLFLFGIAGDRKGMVIYHYLNPFNLFNLDFETFSIVLTILISLLGSFYVYRPFCQFICPFGFISWIAERFSIFRVRVDKEKCTQCGLCIKACPLEAAKGLINGSKLPADCFSCGRCLNVCPVDAIKYDSVFKKNIIKPSPAND